MSAKGTKHETLENPVKIIHLCRKALTFGLEACTCSGQACLERGELALSCFAGGLGLTNKPGLRLTWWMMLRFSTSRFKAAHHLFPLAVSFSINLTAMCLPESRSKAL